MKRTYDVTTTGYLILKTATNNPYFGLVMYDKCSTIMEVVYYNKITIVLSTGHTLLELKKKHPPT